MPRVTVVKKAQKAQGTCGKCGKAIEAGDGYRWIKFRHGGRVVRCLDSKCSFRDSDLTQSKMSGAYSAREDAEDQVGEWDGSDLSDLTSIAEDCAQSIRDVAEEYQSSADSIRDTFSESATADECEEKANGLEEWADEIESAAQDVEEFEPEEQEPECPNCGSTMIKNQAGAWDCNDDNGSGCAHKDFEPEETPEDEQVDSDGQTRSEWAENARSAVLDALGNCPF